MHFPAMSALSANQQDHALSVFTMTFTTDPVMRWVLPSAGNYLHAFADLAHAFGGAAIEKGAAYMADDFNGVAFWLPAGTESDAEGTGVIQRGNWPAMTPIFRPVRNDPNRHGAGGGNPDSRARRPHIHR